MSRPVVLVTRPIHETGMALLAALAGECVIRMATGAACAVLDALEGERPADVVNPEVYG